MRVMTLASVQIGARLFGPGAVLDLDEVPDSWSDGVQYTVLEPPVEDQASAPERVETKKTPPKPRQRRKRSGGKKS